MPGERSGELQLLSTGKEPQTVPAVPKNIPLPSSKPESDTPKSSSQHASPFLASSSAPVAGKASLRFNLAHRSDCQYVQQLFQTS